MNQRTDLRTNLRTRTDVLLLVAFCGFLFFYGIGDQDEERSDERNELAE